MPFPRLLCLLLHFFLPFSFVVVVVVVVVDISCTIYWAVKTMFLSSSLNCRRNLWSWFFLLLMLFFLLLFLVMTMVMFCSSFTAFDSPHFIMDRIWGKKNKSQWIVKTDITKADFQAVGENLNVYWPTPGFQQWTFQSQSVSQSVSQSSVS